MKRRQLLVLSMTILLVLAIGLVPVAACSPSAPATQAPTTQAAAPARLSIAGGSISGSGNLLANAIAGVLKKFMNTDAAVYTYPMTTIAQAVQDGTVQLAYSSTVYTKASYKATGIYKDKKPQPDIREIMPLSLAAMQIFVSVDSPIKTFRDLLGKRIAPGTKAMASATMLVAAAPALGLGDFEKAFSVTYAGNDETAAALVAGKVDAAASADCPPVPVLSQTDLSHPLRLVGFTDADLKIIIAANPGTAPMTIPAKYYHMKEPINTASFFGELICRADLSEDLVYKLTKYTWENKDFLGYYYAVFQQFMNDKETGAQYWLNNSPSDFPFHKGAVKYYKEAGLTIPASRIPPEAK